MNATVMVDTPGSAGARKVAVSPCPVHTTLPLVLDQVICIPAGICPERDRATCPETSTAQSTGRIFTLMDCPPGTQAEANRDNKTMNTNKPSNLDMPNSP